MEGAQAAAEAALHLQPANSPPPELIKEGTELRLPLTPAFRDALERTIRVAIQLDNGAITTTGLLLGVIWVGERGGRQLPVGISAPYSTAVRTYAATLNNELLQTNKSGPCPAPDAVRRRERLSGQPATEHSRLDRARLTAHASVDHPPPPV